MWQRGKGTQALALLLLLALQVGGCWVSVLLLHLVQPQALQQEQQQAKLPAQAVLWVLMKGAGVQGSVVVVVLLLLLLEQHCHPVLAVVSRARLARPGPQLQVLPLSPQRPGVPR